MARLLVHVEGQTEESFVNEVLREFLIGRGYHSVEPKIVGNARLRSRRGGIRPWPSVKKDIANHLRQDSNWIITTMVDFYGLPAVGDAAWPGRAEARNVFSSAQKASIVEDALRESIATEMRGTFDSQRFIPFVVMHEFEGLLFSDCAAFGHAIGRPEVVHRLTTIRNDFQTPEDINDSPNTAPSQRVADIVAGYEKPLFGTLAILEITIERIRAECPHFNSWLATLESLV